MRWYKDHIKQHPGEKVKRYARIVRVIPQAISCERLQVLLGQLFRALCISAFSGNEGAG